MAASREMVVRAFASCLAVLLVTALLAMLPTKALADEALMPTAQDDMGVDYEDAETGAQNLQGDEADPTVSANPVGEEESRGELTKELDEYLSGNFDASGLPGLAVAVVTSSGVRYLSTYGDCTSADQTFIIGSLSKSFTAVCVMQLVEQGAIDLDAPAALYAPSYGVPDVVTVRDLLNQTSGFGYFQSLTEATVGETLGSFSYSNANYDLLGRIVENVSGETYADYLRTNVFDLLGMDDASIDGVEEGRAPEAAGHRNWFGLSVEDGFVHELGDDAWGGPSSGYVRASVSDMAAYLGMYLNSGEGVLKPRSVHQMIFARVPDIDGDAFYGMGWSSFTWDDGELVLAHSGQVENYVADMIIIPDRNIGIVLLADADDELGGNEAFYQMADDVVALSIGGDAIGVDASDSVGSHVGYDLAYLLAIVAAGMPILLRKRWSAKWLGTERPGAVMWAMVVFEHLFTPLLVWSLVGETGMRWQDFCDFQPDQAFVVSVVMALLLAGGVMKMVAWARWRRDARGR